MRNITHTIYRSSKFLGIVFLISVLAGFDYIALWEKLGTKTVDYALDRDVLEVSSKEVYTALKIKIDNGSVNVYKATIHFDNGQLYDIDLPKVMTKNNDGQAIDLKDNKRSIIKIIFWYDTNNTNTEKAVLEIWARK